MKFLNQRKGSYDCGPVAILNVLKWAGYNVSKKRHMDDIKDLCNHMARGGGGVYYKDLLNALSKFKDCIKFYMRHNITIYMIDKHLMNGGIVLMHTSHKREDGGRSAHYWIITGRMGDSYNVHNVRLFDEFYHADTLMSRKEIVYRMKKSLKKYNEPRAIFINRR